MGFSTRVGLNPAPESYDSEIERGGEKEEEERSVEVDANEQTTFVSSPKIFESCGIHQFSNRIRRIDLQSRLSIEGEEEEAMITRSNLAEQLREYQIRSKHDWASVSFFSSTSSFSSSR
ncbi:hypothetical protein DY000_02045983 [Brassica cretica]|uniref:Uncharacterized protein n=1 Tax=Brassica cretica TaxID=69181 RepID=A0ABQ7F5B3_BRACR|nr:hypothetical protein DY000_02045983 [Brassica cretica]